MGDGKKTTTATQHHAELGRLRWYYARYITRPTPTHGREDEFDYWMGPNHNKYSGDEGGVDLYIGGVEHAAYSLLLLPLLAQRCSSTSATWTRPKPFHVVQQ